MVSLVINNRAIPIYFELLDHVGNSDLETQTAILARVLPVNKFLALSSALNQFTGLPPALYLR